MRWTLLIVLALLLAGCADAPDATALTRASTAESEEGALRVAAHPTGAPAFEPTLGVTQEGAVFFSSLSKSLGAPDPALSLVRRSLDGGATWEDVSPRVAGATFPPTSGDPYVHVDRDTGRVFVSDLQALVCSTLSFSDDGGASWTSTPLGCGMPPGVHDHQTVFTAKPRVLSPVAYPNLVHYCVNRVADTACAASLDGGLTFGPLRPLVFASSAGPTGLCGAATGHGAARPDGRILLAGARCGFATVAFSDDDGLTWTEVRIDEAHPLGTFDGGFDHEVALAVDAAGAAYAAWIGDDRRLWFAASPDGGATWNEAVDVTPPDVGTASHPMLGAGSEGVVAFGFVGTNASKAFDDMGEEDAWHAYVGFVRDPLAAAPSPLAARATTDDDPLARGVCGGTRCAKGALNVSGATVGFEGGLGDFLHLVVDDAGRAWAAFVDVDDGPEGLLVTAEP